MRMFCTTAHSIYHTINELQVAITTNHHHCVATHEYKNTSLSSTILFSRGTSDLERGM
jgi:hypothetical protein